MSVLVRGMEMPTSCDICPMMAEADDYCVCFAKNQFIPWRWASESGAEIVHDKPDWCPLVEIPPHGDLIDRDALMKDGWLSLRKEVMRMGGYAIHELPLKNPSIPVIIEAEGET